MRNPSQPTIGSAPATATGPASARWRPNATTTGARTAKIRPSGRWSVAAASASPAPIATAIEGSGSVGRFEDGRRPPGGEEFEDGRRPPGGEEFEDGRRPPGGEEF